MDKKRDAGNDREERERESDEGGGRESNSERKKNMERTMERDGNGENETRGERGDRKRDRDVGGQRGRADKSGGSEQKERRTVPGSLFDVICNTEWPNDATGRDRTWIKVEERDCGD